MQGKSNEARPFYEESLKIRRKVYGNAHRTVAQALSNLAALLFGQVGLLSLRHRDINKASMFYRGS